MAQPLSKLIKMIKIHNKAQLAYKSVRICCSVRVVRVLIPTC